ncbi:NADH-ubiquinone oxidoreductase subunit NDUFA12 family protein [Pelagibacteraceae bacterium]|nr:NADH-ubiquinone oxidoreductase subunit NDUFA12 family protein [Pelagibacteraceae bacterium]
MIFKEIFTWWHNQTVGTRIWSYLNGYNVGNDNFGNTYMRNKNDSKRWVLYKGEVDSTKVPPQWNAWLRYTSNDMPIFKKKYFWERDHIQNQTGTSKSYYPKASVMRDSNGRKKSEYEKWSPNG